MDLPSLKESGSLDAIELSLEQRPLSNWSLLGHVSVFLFVPLGLSLGLVAPAMIWFFAAAAFFVFGLSWKSRARLRITGYEVQIDAWIGLFPRPRHVALPLPGLKAEVIDGSSINRRSIYKLNLEPAEGELVELGSLACSSAELQHVRQELAEAGKRAQRLQGEGQAEIPEPLRKLTARDIP